MTRASTQGQDTASGTGYGWLHKEDGNQPKSLTVFESCLVQEQAGVYAKVLRVSWGGDSLEYRIEFTAIDSHAKRALRESVVRLVEIIWRIAG